MTDDLSPDDDDRLARLYRETADDAEPPGEWSSLRAVIGAARESGFDEEPPARIDALLLAAARQHAPAPRPRWWQRLAAWMKPVMMHPAMAGALALVVVVGVAGVMYRRGDRQVAQPAPPPAPPALTGTAPPSPPDDVAPAVVAEPPAEPVGEPATEAPATAAPATEAPTVPAGPAVKRPPPPTNERKPVGGKGGIGSDRGDTPVVTSGGVTLAPSDEAGEAQAAPDVAQAPPPPPPPTAPKPTAVGDAATVRDGDKALAVAELFRQAQAAARAGDCVRVRAVSAQVLARDPAYHRTVFAADRRIAACLPAQIGY